MWFLLSVSAVFGRDLGRVAEALTGGAILSALAICRERLKKARGVAGRGAGGQLVGVAACGRCGAFIGVVACLVMLGACRLLLLLPCEAFFSCFLAFSRFGRVFMWSGCASCLCGRFFGLWRMGDRLPRLSFAVVGCRAVGLCSPRIRAASCYLSV